MHLNNTTCLPARELKASVFLPTPEDYNCLKRRMEVITCRVLVTHLAQLKELKSSIFWHVKHAHSDAMSHRSQVVSFIISFIIHVDCLRPK